MRDPQLHPVTEATLQELRMATNDIKKEVLAYDDVNASFALMQFLADIARDLADVVNLAGRHTEELIRRRPDPFETRH